jgi:phosphoribosyl 1,2-cyclic phosphodiesterase
VLITHEHCDHTSGLAALERLFNGRLPVYLTRHTAPCLEWGEYVPVVEAFQAGCGFTVGDFDVASFTIPHDAIDPVGYTVSTQGIKVAIATDLGYIPDSLRVHFRETDVLLLEANHDLEMLRVGPYPWSVKQRVMGRRGHLSNEVAAQFIRRDLDTRVSTLILGHISEHNNHPELVRKMGFDALKGRTLFTQLVVAEPGSQSPVFCY